MEEGVGEWSGVRQGFDGRGEIHVVGRVDHFYIAQGHADVFVSQHLHERRQADPEADHLRSEAVTKPVRSYSAGAPCSPGAFG